MSQVRQNGLQTHINMDFFSSHNCNHNFGENESRNNVPHLQSLAGPELQSSIAYIKTYSLTCFDLIQLFPFELLVKHHDQHIIVKIGMDLSSI